MVRLVCPCCGEEYLLEKMPQIGRKVFCGRCQRKHIFYNSMLVPFAFDLSSDVSEREIACPLCRDHFTIDKNDAGEYYCVSCGALFYVALNPEMYAVNLPPPPPPKPTAANRTAPGTPNGKLPPEAFTGYRADVSPDAPLNLAAGQNSRPAEERAAHPVPQPPPAPAPASAPAMQPEFAPGYPNPAQTQGQPVTAPKPEAAVVQNNSDASAKRSLSEELAARLKNNR